MTLITMPSSPAFTRSEWGIKRTVSKSESPYTGATQVYKYPNSQWYANLTLPPMKRSQAVAWQAFFLSAEGIANTFLVGDPDAKAVNGSATSATVAATAAIGATEVNLNIGAGNTLNRGSYLQLGTAGSARLYMIVDDNTSDGIVSIQPSLKTAITGSTTAAIVNAKGAFRMANNDQSWSANEISIYGLTFSIVEAL
jgi:hypothetical protein